MSHLLAISLGPVQEFIAAGRRTADLSAGSDLLVQLARVAAASLEESVATLGGSLIFPVDSTVDGANKLLVHLASGDPAAVAEEARGAVLEELRGRWRAMLADPQHGKTIRSGIDATLGEDQIEHFLEWFAAWTPLDRPYAEAREEVELLLAGRKALRDFAQPMSKARLPKSPLDPSRDCVLDCAGHQHIAEHLQDRHPLWLKPSETLDAISLLKRWRGQREAADDPTPSTSLVAFAAIEPRLRRRHPEELGRLDELVNQAGSGVDLGDLIYPGRREVSDLKKLSVDEQAEIDKLVSELLKGLEPPPYYAILVADGDRVGGLLGELAAHADGMERHRKFSSALGDFSREVRGLIPVGGFLVYSGGDDVLALLPANLAIDTAKIIEECYRRALATIAPTATMSAGIALVHYNVSLAKSLEHAREAERAAKDAGRDRLCVAYHPRGGSPVRCTLQWATAKDEWDRWSTSLDEELSRGLPYELRELAREYEPPHRQGTRSEATGMPVSRIEAEVRRIWARKKGGTPPALPRLEKPAELIAFAEQLIIARYLAGLKRISDERDPAG